MQTRQTDKAMKTYRVGEGQSPSGKILGNTKWFNDYDSAKEWSQKTGEKIYVSINNQKYVEIE